MGLRLCFLAPSSYGKSTAVNILSKSFNLVNVKIAAPLYEMQDAFYKRLNISMTGGQDGELLQFLGFKVRKESPMFLLNNFFNRVCAVEQSIVVNDDCRPADCEYLKSMGFVFVKINGFKRDRIDHTKSDDNSGLEWQNNILFDYEVNNFGTIEEYEQELMKLMEVILNERQVLCYTRTKNV